MTKRKRADVALVERGLFESRARAQAAIAAGLVTANGIALRKARNGCRRCRSACRAGASLGLARRIKLCGGASTISASIRQGAPCLDVGASTALHRGAARTRRARVYAVDVGRAQLHTRPARRQESDLGSRRPISAGLDPLALAPLPDFALSMSPSFH